MANVSELLHGQLRGKIRTWLELADTSHVPGVGAVVVQSTVPAEVVVAGAASVLGKIGTVAAGATIFVRIPCATTNPATARAIARIQVDKGPVTVTKYRSRTVLNAPTITLASVQNNDTVIINGLTFTAHTDTTVTATRQFSIAGTDTEDAHELVSCINVAFAALGLTADHALGVVTLTATTATTTQCVTGVGGARIVCAQTFPGTLERIGDPYNNPIVISAANNTTTGDGIEIVVDGYPHIYLGISNGHATDACTLVVGSTLLPF